MRKERPEVVKVVTWAAGNGDRSENGDYIYGKKRLREIDRRIRFLSKRLANAEVVDPAKRRQDRPGLLRRHRDLRPTRRARNARSRSSASTRSISPRAMSAGSRRSPGRCCARRGRRRGEDAHARRRGRDRDREGRLRVKWRVMVFRTASLRLAQAFMSEPEARGPKEHEHDAPLQRGGYSARSGAPQRRWVLAQRRPAIGFP